jgi:hypothetical protein
MTEHWSEGWSRLPSCWLHSRLELRKFEESEIRSSSLRKSALEIASARRGLAPEIWWHYLSWNEAEAVAEPGLPMSNEERERWKLEAVAEQATLSPQNLMDLSLYLINSIDLTEFPYKSATSLPNCFNYSAYIVQTYIHYQYKSNNFLKECLIFTKYTKYQKTYMYKVHMYIHT